MCAGVKIGGVYIPPEDSLYCDAAPLQALNAKCAERDVIVLGDLNACIGILVITSRDGVVYEFGNVIDTQVNSHGLMLINMCNGNNMIVMNHLKRDSRTLGGIYHSGEAHRGSLKLIFV